MNKAAHYVPYDTVMLRKDTKVVVDGRKLYTDGTCLSNERFRRLLIDLGEVLSIHHITTYTTISSGLGFFGINIPFFFSVPSFCWYSFFLHVTMSTVSAADRKISTFYKDDAGMERSSRKKGLWQLY